MATTKTNGQIAYEAFAKAIGTIDKNGEATPPWSGASRNPKWAESWEAAAAAVLAANTSPTQ